MDWKGSQNSEVKESRPEKRPDGRETKLLLKREKKDEERNG